MPLLQRLPWMAGWLLALLPLSAPALILNENLQGVKILTHHPGNVVVLNRGVEDGVQVGSHGKLKGTAGYVARGLCVKVGMLTSHWRLYRVVDPELVSKDFAYVLEGIDASEPAPHVEALKAQDHTRLPDFDEKKLMPPEKSALKNDLPAGLTDDPQLHQEKKGAPAMFVEKTFDKDRLKRDLKVMKGSVFASPWSVQSGPTDVKTVRFGGRLENEGGKYGLRLTFDRSTLTAAEKRSGEEFRNESTEARGTFTVRNLTPAWDAFSDLNWRQARYGEDWAPQRQILFAPLGFTWRREPGKTLKRMELSWAPTYDTRQHVVAFPGDREQGADENGLRHAFRWYMDIEVNPHFHLTNELRWRPMQDIGSWELDTADNLSQNRFTASWQLTGPLHVDYEFLWLDDAQLRRINGISRVVTTNSLNVRLDFEL